MMQLEKLYNLQETTFSTVIFFAFKMIKTVRVQISTVRRFIAENLFFFENNYNKLCISFAV